MTKRGGKQSRCRERQYRPHVIPGGPTFDIGGPKVAGMVSRRIYRCKGIVRSIRRRATVAKIRVIL